jgi:hypothetical protein
MATTTNTAPPQASKLAAWDSNSVQLNIVSFVDVDKAAATRSAVGTTYMMDNNPNSPNRGTSNLQTICKQGQVLNWIIYAMDMDRRPDGTWPPSVRINNIVFLDDAGINVSIARVVDELKILGGPDKIRSPYTPVYYYWAGIVQNDLPPGVYNYRFVLELDMDDDKKVYINMDGQSLRVEAIDGPKT